MAQRLPLRILLAEDHVTNQKLALMMLKKLGYRADVAANGLEAVDAVQRQTYDVVLMDMQMPEMDGLQATRQIRELLSDPREPYIVAMTANAMQGDRELCLAAGMNDYVSKPVRVEALIEALENSKPEWQGAPAEKIELDGGSQAGGTSAPSSAYDVLDREALIMLLEVIGGEWDLLVELIDSFLEEAPPLLSGMREALESGDSSALRLTAHTLKSSGHDFGATEFARLCQQLEDLGQSGQLDGSAVLVEQIESEYERVDNALLAAKEGPSPDVGRESDSSPETPEMAESESRDGVETAGGLDEPPTATEPATDFGADSSGSAPVHTTTRSGKLLTAQPTHEQIEPDRRGAPISMETVAALIGRHPALLEELLETVYDGAPHLAGDIQQWFDALDEWHRSRPRLELSDK
jgi:CheY-like chemotaxis protein/HPt (histidine-containing phosphotransfer) domain-containing protein